MERRNPQTGVVFDTSIPGAISSTSLATITAPQTSFATIDTAIATAPGPSTTYTSVKSTFAISSVGTNGRTTTSTITSEYPITNSAEYASITSAEAANSSSHSTSASASESSSSAASTAASTSKTTNTGILIPAIVIPVVVILLASLLGFWLIMRRRSRKEEAKELEMVMQTKNEKPHNSSSRHSLHSHSSTRELVPIKNKEIEVDVRPVPRTSIELFPPRSANQSQYSAPQSPRQGSTITDINNPSGPPVKAPTQVRNFSRGPGSRPSTAQSNRPVDRGLPFTPQDHRGPPSRSRQAPGSTDGPRDRQSPVARGAPKSEMGGLSKQKSTNPYAPPPSGRTSSEQQNGGRGPQLDAGIINRDVLVASCASPPTPTGAYNGASPISQYSPLIRDTSKFGTSPPTAAPIIQAAAGARKPPPSAIKTAAKPPASPSDSNFTEENMRIARLANDSRLGFHAVTTTTFNSLPVSPNSDHGPAHSPRLPPPATRDAPPSNMSVPAPPPIPIDNHNDGKPKFANDRRSVVSRMTEDDGYDDVEVDDAKSDVSSLDEREKWQSEQDINNPNRSQTGLGGYGGLGRPPLIDRNLLNRDSSVSGSNYSLGGRY